MESLKTESSSAVSQRSVTLKEVEEGAVSLRKVGENLAGLKGNIEMPLCLFMKMRNAVRGLVIETVNKQKGIYFIPNFVQSPASLSLFQKQLKM